MDSSSLVGLNKRDVLKKLKDRIDAANDKGLNRWINDRFLKWEGVADEQDVETLIESIESAEKEHSLVAKFGTRIEDLTDDHAIESEVLADNNIDSTDELFSHHTEASEDNLLSDANELAHDPNIDRAVRLLNEKGYGELAKKLHNTARSSLVLAFCQEYANLD